MSNLSLFNFQSKDVRTSVVNDEVWFVASDICSVLEISDVRQAIERLDDDERGGYSVPTPGGEQKAAHINESGLYNLIFTSRKAEAKTFKRWVTKEVLPSIRKTGTYTLQKELDAKTAEVTLLSAQKGELDAICASAKMSPKVELVRTAKSLEKVSGASAARNHTLEVAKELSDKELTEWKHRALTAELQLALITKGFKS